MKYIIIISSLFLLKANTILSGQIKPVCDEVVEIPESYLFNFFVILPEDNSQISIEPGARQNFRIEVVADNPNSTIVLYRRTQAEPFLERSGFVSFELINGSGSQSFGGLANHMNDNPDANYYANLYAQINNQYVLMGTKELNAVPYAQVANTLGGKGRTGQNGAPGAQGPQGPQAPTGATGPQGEQGPMGAIGTFDFDNTLLIMTSVVPSSGTFYVDDGTNTADGQPHLRFNHNGNWIDL